MGHDGDVNGGYLIWGTYLIWRGSFSWLHGDGMWLNGIFLAEQIS